MATVNIERRPDPKAELGYVCPECKAWSHISQWRETEVGCEDCGDHPALRCPECEEDIDTVFTDFEDAESFLEQAAKAGGIDTGCSLAEALVHIERAIADFRVISMEPLYGTPRLSSDLQRVRDLLAGEAKGQPWEAVHSRVCAELGIRCQPVEAMGA
ncbi:hypothetical protein B2G69_07725 [Methylorubrum zatmanii]|nr:hypothetical protein [Methylorubrum zatmanii]ARO54044.1 hypothetical protein B2G69_07725 [Methylorubrum zatmanii]